MLVHSIKECAVLANGRRMPWLGLGTFKSREGEEVERAVRHALDLGYRHIDTASIYGNEAGVGRAVHDSSVAREDIFITTKVWNSDQGYEPTLAAFDQSLERLGMDYVDLYLVHWPVEKKFTETWRALEQLHRDGRARAIGVSNFLIHHLRELLKTAQIVPMVNQIEFHPHLVQPKLLAFCRERKIQVEAWSPLMRGDIGKVPEIEELAGKYNKTPAQLVLRWNLQHQIVTIPKSVNAERIAENANIFDFELSEEDMDSLDSLDRNRRIGPDPDKIDF